MKFMNQLLYNKKNLLITQAIMNYHKIKLIIFNKTSNKYQKIIIQTSKRLMKTRINKIMKFKLISPQINNKQNNKQAKHKLRNSRA